MDIIDENKGSRGMVGSSPVSVLLFESTVAGAHAGVACRCKTKSPRTFCCPLAHQHRAEPTDKGREARIPRHYRDSGRTCFLIGCIQGCPFETWCPAGVERKYIRNAGWRLETFEWSLNLARLEHALCVCLTYLGSFAELTKLARATPLHDISRGDMHKVVAATRYSKARGLMLLCCTGGGTEGRIHAPSSRRFPTGRASARCPRHGYGVAKATG